MHLILAVILLLIAGYIGIWYHGETLRAQPWEPDADAIYFGQRPFFPVGNDSRVPAFPVRVKGRYIVDSQDERFKLISINWYGGSDEHFIPGGLEVQHRSKIAKNIRRLGFNSVRLPYSDEMIVSNPEILPHLLAANPDLVGSRALDVFAAVVDSLTEAGVAVILNNHITSAKWCCGPDLCNGLWHNDQVVGSFCRVRQTEEDWIQNWETIMTPHINNSLVIGADLRNEVRAVYLSWDEWARAAERAGNRLLSLNPNWLIVVEGLGSANFLNGVKDRPIKLSVPNRCVYSAHCYSWSGWGSLGGSYSKRTYSSFAKSMSENWGYLLEGDIAPVWLGEFGSADVPTKGDANYWKNLMRYLREADVDFGYWAVNPRKPANFERESYSLVEDDWLTPVLDYRLRDMQELMD